MPIFTDRQQILYDLLQAQKRISTEDIKEKFDISSATASRDIHALIVAGVAVKASYGVKLAPPVEPTTQEKICAFCSGTVQGRTAFIIQLQDGTSRNACCCHCGLMALEQSGAQSALATDFLSGRMVNARQATYLLGSRVNLCCEPSALCFASRDDASCFRLGFSGELYTMEEAIRKLKGMMTL